MEARVWLNTQGQNRIKKIPNSANFTLVTPHAVTALMNILDTSLKIQLAFQKCKQ